MIAIKKLILFLGVLLIVIIYIFNQSITSKNQPVLNDVPSWVEENSNVVSYGLYDSDGNIINASDKLTCPKNNQLNNTLSFSHFFKNGGDYGLIILADFKQTEFQVNNDNYKLYPFKIQPNSSININITVPIENNTKEISYIIVKKPNFFMRDENLKTATFLREVIVLRYNFEDSNGSLQIDTKYKKGLKTYSKATSTGIFTSNVPDLSKIIFNTESNKDAYIRVGNETQVDLDFALIAFKDWEQIPLLDNELINYVKSSDGETQVYNLRFPEVKKLSNYQVIAFPKPYNYSNDNNIEVAYPSPRTTIYPNK